MGVSGIFFSHLSSLILKVSVFTVDLEHYDLKTIKYIKIYIVIYLHLNLPPKHIDIAIIKLKNKFCVYIYMYIYIYICIYIYVYRQLPKVGHHFLGFWLIKDKVMEILSVLKFDWTGPIFSYKKVFMCIFSKINI